MKDKIKKTIIGIVVGICIALIIKGLLKTIKVLNERKNEEEPLGI